MRKSTRRLIFYSLVVLFIFVTPFFILFALGYIPNFTERTLEARGGIFVKSNARNLSVFLNNAFIKETSLLTGGALLTDIPPGEYLLRLEHAGLAPWSKTVWVEAAKVTEFRNIILTPQSPTVATSTKSEQTAITAHLERMKKKTDAKPRFVLDKKNNLIDRTGTSTEIVAPNVHSFMEIDDSILFVDTNGFLAQFDIATNSTATIGRPGFLLTEDPLTFIHSPNRHIAIRDASGGIFLLDYTADPPFITTTSGPIREIVFSHEDSKLLLIGDNGIDLLWLSDNQHQPFQTKGTRETILKLKSPIRETTWFYETGAHAVFRTDDGVYLIEIDGRGGRNTAELTSGKIAAVVTVPEIPHAVFFKKRKLWYSVTP